MSGNGTTTEAPASREKLDNFGEPWPPSRYLLRLRERYHALKSLTHFCLNELGVADWRKKGRGPVPMSYEVAETFFALFQDLEEAQEGVEAWEKREGVGIGRVRRAPAEEVSHAAE